MVIEQLDVTRLRRAVAWSIATLLFTTPFSAQNQDPALVDAAERQDWQTVSRLVDANVDVNGTQADGATALQWAAHWDHLEAVDRFRVRVSGVQRPFWSVRGERSVKQLKVSDTIPKTRLESPTRP